MRGVFVVSEEHSRCRLHYPPLTAAQNRGGSAAIPFFPNAAYARGTISSISESGYEQHGWK